MVYLGNTFYAQFMDLIRIQNNEHGDSNRY